MDNLSLLNNECFWCDNKIMREHHTVVWADDYGSTSCEFHPAAWDNTLMRTTHEIAPHQTVEDVNLIVKLHYYNTRKSNTPTRTVGDNVVSISKNAKGTSRNAANKILPRSGSIRQKVYEAIQHKHMGGLTDHELEQALNGKHQTVSASRRSLVLDGFIVDSGQTRKNPQGNDCIVWIDAKISLEKWFPLNG